jgi:hypothetical protein
MNLHPTASGVSRGALLTLVALESMPCGCVSGVYESTPTLVAVELVEAKGPHCVFIEHRAGGVVRLGLVEDASDVETLNSREELAQ